MKYILSMHFLQGRPVKRKEHKGEVFEGLWDTLELGLLNQAGVLTAVDVGERRLVSASAD